MNSLLYLIRFFFRLEGGEEIGGGHSEEENGGCGSGGSRGNQTGGGQGGSKVAGAIAGARQSISTVEVADWEGSNNTAGGLIDYFSINTYIDNQK